jgi:exopolyphosphatase/guanosine-5'-triphosphate,3'-diphosphate pyrophosphatase
MTVKSVNFASIDIGSNAVRFLLSYVIETEEGPFFRKGILLRVPVRLGEDAFLHKRILKSNRVALMEAMHSFKHLMNVKEIQGYKAFATSAMREASNGEELVNQIEKETGIHIQIISGDKEADVISGDNIPAYLAKRKKLLYMDVGGGSTEFTFYEKKSTERRSFNIGTLRLKNGLITPRQWEKLESWLEELGLKDSGVPIVGSGGNINKIFKLKRAKDRYYITSEDLFEFYEEANQLTETERITTYNVNPDRADVILPASRIFINVIKTTGTKKIFVPKTGLSDGIVRQLYTEYITEQ